MFHFWIDKHGFTLLSEYREWCCCFCNIYPCNKKWYEVAQIPLCVHGCDGCAQCKDFEPMSQTS